MTDETAAVNPLAKGAPMPKSIGLCADLYHEIRELRLAMEKEADAVKDRETEIKDYIIDNLSKSQASGGDSGAAGMKYRAQVTTTPTPRLTDWAAFTKAVQESGRFDLMQKRLSDKAVEGLWEAGFAVPGVEKVNVVGVSITKI